MAEVNFIEKMYKKINKWSNEEVNNSTYASGVYKDLEYSISGNKILDSILIKGTLEDASIILKQTGDRIEFTCKDVTIVCGIKEAGMETVYSIVNAIIEEFKSNKK